MNRSALATFAAAVALSAAMPAAPLAAGKPPATWDDLVLVPSKKLDLVYLAAGADFRPYTKVMIDTPEVAFKKNWVRDYNNSTRMKRISEDDAQKAVQKASAGFADILAKAYTDAGFQIVQAPGPDVLRARTGIVNLAVSAP